MKSPLFKYKKDMEEDELDNRIERVQKDLKDRQKGVKTGDSE